MTIVTIHDGADFKIASHGNGWAYLIVNKSLDRDMWLQDDDATQFRNELDALERAQPERATDSIIGELWNMYHD